MNIPTIKLNILPFSNACLMRFVCRTPTLFLKWILCFVAQKLARYHPWACLSENLVALRQQCVHVFYALSSLHISWDIRHIATVSSTRPQMHCLTRRLSSLIRMVLRNFGNVRTAHPVYLFSFNLFLPPSFCLFSDVLSSARCKACIRFTAHLSFHLS